MRSWMVVGLIGSLACAGSLGRAESEAAVSKALAKRYAEVTRAFQKHDARAYDAILSPDYVLKLPGGHTVSRDQVEADFARQMNAAHDVTWKRRIEKLTVSGDEAVATVRGHFRGAIGGPQGASHRQELDALTRDTWTRADGGWKLKASELLEMHMTMDGKPAGRPGG